MLPGTDGGDGDVDLTHNLIQISINGPNVNLKAVIANYYHKAEAPIFPDLLDIDRCEFACYALHLRYLTKSYQIDIG